MTAYARPIGQSNRRRQGSGRCAVWVDFVGWITEGALSHHPCKTRFEGRLLMDGRFFMVSICSGFDTPTPTHYLLQYTNDTPPPPRIVVPTRSMGGASVRGYMSAIYHFRRHVMMELCHHAIASSCHHVTIPRSEETVAQVRKDRAKSENLAKELSLLHRGETEEHARALKAVEER